MNRSVKRRRALTLAVLLLLFPQAALTAEAAAANASAAVKIIVSEKKIDIRIDPDSDTGNESPAVLEFELVSASQAAPNYDSVVAAAKNSEVVSVSVVGRTVRIMGLKYGKTKVTITEPNSKKKATVSVNVYENPIGLSITGKDTVAPGKSITLKAVIENKTRVHKDDRGIEWYTESQALTVNAGKVTGIRAGGAERVYAQTVNGKSCAKDVVVSDYKTPSGSVKALVSRKPLTDPEAKRILTSVTTPNKTKTRIKIGGQEYGIEIDSNIMAVDPAFNTFLKNTLYEPDGSIKPDNARTLVNTIAAGINKGLRAEDPKAKQVIGYITADQRLALYVSDGKSIVEFPGCQPIEGVSIGHDFLHVFCQFDQPGSDEDLNVQPAAPIKGYASKKPLSDPRARSILTNIKTPNGNKTQIKIGNRQYYIEIDTNIMAIDPNFNSFLKNRMYEPDGSVTQENAQYFADTVVAGMNRGLKALNPKAMLVKGHLTPDLKLFLYMSDGKTRLRAPSCSPTVGNSIGHTFLHEFYEYDSLMIE